MPLRPELIEDLQTDETDTALVLKPDGVCGVEWVADANATFGFDYQTAASLGTSTTTSATFQVKLSMTTTAVTGTYRVVGYMRCWNDGDLGEFRLQNTTDAVTVGEVVVFKPTDSDERARFVWVDTAIVFAGVAKTFELQFRDGGGGGHTTNVSNAFIEFWRVA